MEIKHRQGWDELHELELSFYHDRLCFMIEFRENARKPKEPMKITFMNLKDVNVIMGPTFSKDSLAVEDDPTWYPFYIWYEYEQLTRDGDAEATMEFFKRVVEAGKITNYASGLKMYM